MLRDPPFLLLKPWTALRALRPTGVVLAAADEDVGVTLRIRQDTVVGVSIAHTATADTDVFDAVEVLLGDVGTLLKLDKMVWKGY